MSEGPHPLAPHDLPAFITAPGETDVLMVIMSLFLVFAVVMFGVLFFRLHSLPERIAHKSHKIQFEIVAVLCLISLFTHMHIFWIIAILLALIEIPDFTTPLRRIAGSVERMAGTPAEPEATTANDPALEQSERAKPVVVDGTKREGHSQPIQQISGAA
jgi:amino acid transporter